MTFFCKKVQKQLLLYRYNSLMSSTFQHLNYYPFGMLMEERSYTATAKGYRFGFNGKEMDDETFDGAIAFEARIYDSRLGRFFSTDPWEHKYAWQSTYSYYKNCPISILDFLGKGGEDDPPKSSGGGLYDFLKKVTKDGQITDEDDIGQVSVSVHAKGYSEFPGREDKK